MNLVKQRRFFDCLERDRSPLRGSQSKMGRLKFKPLKGQNVWAPKALVSSLTRSLINPPSGASIVPDSGLFTLRLPVALASTTNTVRVAVAKNGSPRLCDTQIFTFTVNPIPPVMLTTPGFSTRQFQLDVTGPVGPDYIMVGGSLTSRTSLTTHPPGAMPFTFTKVSAPRQQRLPCVPECVSRTQTRRRSEAR